MLKLFKAKSLKNNTKQSAKNKNAKKQRGRSMVEMLGVLAIIGVLSIGGIQGYTLAMRKYRANEILNVVQKYAMVVYTGCQQAIEKNPQEYGIISENFQSGYAWIGNGIWYCPLIDFENAGLGVYPAGVRNIGGSSIFLTTIKSLSSGDAVVVLVEFETKELCESVMGITGKPLIENGTGWGHGMLGSEDRTCDEEKELAIVTMMN